MYSFFFGIFTYTGGSMAVFTHEEYKKLEIPKEFKPQSCFFCDRPLENSDNDIGGLVYWHGNGTPLTLHQSCAILLSVHLIQDARSLVTKTGEEIQIDEGRRKNRAETWYLKDKK